MTTTEEPQHLKVLNYDEVIAYLDHCEKYELRASTSDFVVWLEEHEHAASTEQ